MPPSPAPEEVELDLLLEGVYRLFGYDFRAYARASLRRRILNLMRNERLQNITQVLEKVLHTPGFVARLVGAISVPSTAMFRDPDFYRAFRRQVIPLLRSVPFVRIWHAGCSTGEEVYSLAIMLLEEGLYKRCRIYATDMNESSLAYAREGCYPLRHMAEYARNYEAAGGHMTLADYYDVEAPYVRFQARLQENLVFSSHNLATDASFNEFHVILCRNVMIYFEATLQARVVELLYESLDVFGVLALGQQETLRGRPHEADFERLDADEKIFRKMR